MMNNKVLVTIYVPKLEKKYDMFLPIGKKVGEVIQSLEKMMFDVSGEYYNINNTARLTNRITGMVYDNNMTIKESKIYHFTELILL